VELMTDNRNRTASEMRHLFSKNSGNLGETGSVSWMFTEKGQLDVPKEDLKMDEDEIMLLALEAGAEDVASEDESYEIFTEPSSMQEVRQVLLDSKIPIESAAINLIPVNRVEIADIEQAKKIIKLIDSLESHDDVQKVYTNFDLAESLEDADF